MTEADIEHLSDIGGNTANVAMSCYLTYITNTSASRRTINCGNHIIRLKQNVLSRRVTTERQGARLYFVVNLMEAVFLGNAKAPEIKLYFRVAIYRFT